MTETSPTSVTISSSTTEAPPTPGSHLAEHDPIPDVDGRLADDDVKPANGIHESSVRRASILSA
jgi:hypothetical protein